MRKISIKNYFILLGLFLVMVIITFSLAKLYNNVLKPTSVLYKYAKNISSRELIDYLQENPSTIIYLGDKYNTLLDDQEKVLKNKIIELNLYNNFIYIDKNEISNSFYSDFNKKYNTYIDKAHIPIVIILNDSELENIYYSLNIETINNIDLGGIK